MMTRIPNTQKGLTLPELLIYIAVLAGVSIFAGTQFGKITDATQTQQAHVELETIRNAARTYRAAPTHRNYSGISLTILANNGYNVNPFAADNLINVYGETVTIAAANPNTQATITYPTNAGPSCLQLVERYTSLRGIVGTPVCDTDGELTLTIK